MVSQEYGPRAETAGSIFCSVGIFISVVAQVLSATALLTTIFPLSHLAAALISILLMGFYVIFGGMWGAGMGGVAKLILLYASAIVGGILVYGLANGFGGLLETLEQLLTSSPLGAVSGLATEEAVHQRFTSLVAGAPPRTLDRRCPWCWGCCPPRPMPRPSGQARADSAARKGALLSALLIPPIGVACILIGLYMRGHCITAEEVAGAPGPGPNRAWGSHPPGFHLPGVPGVCGPVYAPTPGRGGAGHPVYHGGGRGLRAGLGDGLHSGHRPVCPEE